MSAIPARCDWRALESAWTQRWQREEPLLETHPWSLRRICVQNVVWGSSWDLNRLPFVSCFECSWHSFLHSKLTVACLFVSCYATWYHCSIFTGFLFGSIENETNTNDNSYIMNNLPRALWLHSSYPPLPLTILLLNISLEWPTWIGLEYLYEGSERLSLSSLNVCGTHCD